MALSLQQRLARAPEDVRERFLAGLTPAEADRLRYDAEFVLRPDQLAVVDDLDTYIRLLLAGRGWGKSLTAAHWLARRALKTPGDYALVAPKFADAKSIEINGESGLLQAIHPDDIANHDKSLGVITLTNGSRIVYRGANLRMGGVRGFNLKAAVVAEAAAIPVATLVELIDEHLIPALRKGANPQLLLVCTPKPYRWLRDYVAGRVEGVTVTRGRTEDNTALSRKVIARMRAKLTARQARQELDAEILEDVEGALWTASLIDEHRILATERPELTRIVVSVDPAGTPDGDEVGIVVAGIGVNGELYVLDDRSCTGLTPERWARRAVQTYIDWGANTLLTDNYGAQVVEDLIRMVARQMAAEGAPIGTVPVKRVNASVGKVARAEPVSALYEHGRVHHVDTFPELEDQMTSWTPQTGQSPGRLDALVVAATELDVKQRPAAGTVHVR